MAKPNDPSYSDGDEGARQPRSSSVTSSTDDANNTDDTNVGSDNSSSRRAADRFQIFEQVALERLQAGSDSSKAAAFLPLPVRLTAIAAAGIAGLGVLWSVTARVPIQVNATAALVPPDGLHSLPAGANGFLNFQVNGLGTKSISQVQQQGNALLKSFWLNDASVTTNTVDPSASLDRVVRAALAPAPGVPFVLPEGLSNQLQFDVVGARQIVTYPEGTVLARIMDPTTHQELNAALLSSVPTDRLQNQQQQDRIKRATQLGSLTTLQSQQRQKIQAELNARLDYYKRMLELWKKGYVPATTLMEEQTRINGLRASLLSSDSETINTTINKRDQLDQAKQSKIASIDTRNKLEAQLTSYLAKTILFAPGDGFYVMSNNFKNGQFVRANDEILTYTTSPPELPSDVPVFLDNAAIQQVNEGMSVLMTPKGISRAQYGGIPGKVIEVSKLPLQSDALIGIVGSRSMSSTIQQIVATPYIARVRLEQANPRYCKQDLSRLCYRWSSGRQPPHPVRLATLADVQITTTYQRPIEYVMPAIRKALGLVTDNKNK